MTSLKRRLEQPDSGFKSYIEVQQWLLDTLGVKAEYRTVHELVLYRLQAKLKAARPTNSKQDPHQIEALKKNLAEDLELLKQDAVWTQDTCRTTNLQLVESNRLAVEVPDILVVWSG